MKDQSRSIFTDYGIFSGVTLFLELVLLSSSVKHRQVSHLIAKSGFSELVTSHSKIIGKVHDGLVKKHLDYSAPLQDALEKQ